MGTVVSFHATASPYAWVDLADALERARSRLHGLASELTTFDPMSPMSRVRAGGLAPSDAPASVRAVLECCEAVRDLSDGWFDPWALPDGVDPTGLAKGWVLEETIGVLRRQGVASAIVNGGGDLCTFGAPPYGWPWRVGVRHPWRKDALACVLAVSGAVATSGRYERGDHLIDPRRGARTVAAASATVVGPSLAIADGLATALAVGGDAVLELIGSLDTYDGYLIRSDGSEAMTPGIELVADGRPYEPVRATR